MHFYSKPRSNLSIIKGGRAEEPSRDNLSIKLRAEQGTAIHRKLTVAEIEDLRHDHERLADKVWSSARSREH